MFAQQNRDYSGITQRPVNYSQNLWRVDDTELRKPGERFLSDGSAYLDSIVEQGIAGPLESAPLPKGLKTFIVDYVGRLGAVPTKYSSIEDVVFRVLRWLDFEEFYYLLFGSLVQQNYNQMKFTYRLKKDGTVLSPKNLECFGVNREFKFEQFKACQDFMEHPMVKAVLAGQEVKHQTKNRPVDKDDILEKISEILYGDYKFLLSDIEQWIYTFYESIESSRMLTDEEEMQLESEKQLDLFFWTSVTLSSLMWFRSPYAVRFLSEYHPVYEKLLMWNSSLDRMVVIPESGGEAVVDGWDIYTRKDLIVEENKPPGTCESCKQTLHCTKYVNAQALFEPVCSCGKLVSVEDVQFIGHTWNSNECGTYLKIHPPFNAFVCQRCIQVAIDGLDSSKAKCQRTICPATQCVHHIGAKAHAYELSKRRMQLLTHRSA